MINRSAGVSVTEISWFCGEIERVIQEMEEYTFRELEEELKQLSSSEIGID